MEINLADLGAQDWKPEIYKVLSSTLQGDRCTRVQEGFSKSYNIILCSLPKGDNPISNGGRLCRKLIEVV